MGLHADIAAIPVVDHHCHVGMDTYRDDSGRLRDVEAHEFAYARGYVESRIGSSAYRELLLAQRDRDPGALARLESAHGIAELTREALEFRSTTAFAHSLEEGLRRLHGCDDPREASRAARDAGTRALYDRALDLVNCERVYTDVRVLDSPEWDGPRYRWIVRVDAYLHPFGTRRTSERGEEVESFSQRFRRDLDARLEEVGHSDPPADYSAYLEFVDQSIDHLLAHGASGFKIASAYTRSLRFVDRDAGDAAVAWQAARAGDMSQRTVFEDHILFRVVRRIAAAGKPIQIHVGSGHGEPGMDYEGVRPGNLQSLFSDPTTAGASFVLIHGGYPYSSETAIMAHTYGNVYLDFSWMPYLHRTFLTARLNEWLEFLPANKVMFGSDTGLPEMHVAAVDQGRESLVTALETGRRRGLWGGPTALWLAERVLRMNTLDLYEEKS